MRCRSAGSTIEELREQRGEAGGVVEVGDVAGSFHNAERSVRQGLRQGAREREMRDVAVAAKNERRGEDPVWVDLSAGGFAHHAGEPPRPERTDLGARERPV